MHFRPRVRVKAARRSSQLPWFPFAMATLLALALMVSFRARAHSGNEPVDPPVRLSDRTSAKKVLSPRPLVCADLLTNFVDSIEKMEIADRAMTIRLDLKARLRNLLRAHKSTDSVNLFMDRFAKNAVALSAVMKVVPKDRSARGSYENSLRTWMLHELMTLVTIDDIQGVETDPYVMKQLLDNQSHISVLAEMVAELEKSLPSEFIVEIISQELAAVLFQHGASPVSIHEALMDDPDLKADNRDTVTAAYNYRVTAVLECAGLGLARDKLLCDAFAPLRDSFSDNKFLIPRTYGAKTRLTTYEPREGLAEYTTVVAKATALAWLTERIFLWGYSFDENGIGGHGDSKLMHPYADWLNSWVGVFAKQLKFPERMKVEDLRQYYGDVTRLYDVMIPHALRTYARVRLLQGPSTLNGHGKMVSTGTDEQVSVSRESADRVVLPYFKTLNSAIESLKK